MADSRQQPTPLRMGILGAAVIAPFALVNPARTMDDVVVTAIAARDPARAQTFAAKHGIPTVHAGYDALLADPEIDAVYVPLPNNLHAAWSIKALEAGKHVLCEKPMAANGDEARAMARAADATGLALIEAFHYRYHPLAVRAREIEIQRTMAEQGRRFMGRRKLMKQRWDRTPRSAEERFGVAPRVAASSKWLVLAELQRDEAWEKDYAKARACLLAGRPAVFPAGTYWLRRFAGVEVAEQPP